MINSVAGQVFTSCTAGASPCNDTGAVMVGPPIWADLIGLIVIVAAVITIVALNLRRVRRRRASVGE